MKTWALILSVFFPVSVACSIPILHGHFQMTGKSQATGASEIGVKQTAANTSFDDPFLTASAWHSQPFTGSFTMSEIELKQAAAKLIPVKRHPVTPLAHIPSGVTASPLDPADEKVFLEYCRVSNHSLNLAKQGDAAAEKRDWRQAHKYYRKALAVWPDNSLALYGMGRCADTAGDTASAVKYYRTATYADNSPHSIYNSQTNDSVRLMEFVLLLSKAGQEQEALTVYRRAVGFVNYMDGHQNVDVLLPDFQSGGWAYTPQRLQAMAHLGLAVGHGYPGNWETKKALVDIQEANRLAPDSPLPYFYKGRRLVGIGGRSRETLAAFRMATQLGDDDTKAMVDKKLKDYSIEADAKVEQEMEDIQKNKAAQKQ